ncbi:MAG: hypothetical protein AB8B87_25880 [Granulosicoccus sp.]
MNRIGYTPIRALSVGGAYGDLRDDWDTLTKKEKKWLDIIPWFIAALAAILLVCTFRLGGSAVHVSSRTEHLVYTPLFSDPPVWLLKDTVFENADLNDANLFDDDSDTPASYREIRTATIDNKATPNVNGFLQLNCGDRVIVSRLGTGLVKVDVNAVQDVVVTDDVGDAVVFDKPLKKSFSFYPHAKLKEDGTSPTHAIAESMASSSYVWPMEGQIIPSRAVGVDTVATQGLMLSGRVELLNRRVIGDGSYSVAVHDLELGDHLVLATANTTEDKRNSVLKDWTEKMQDPAFKDSSVRILQTPDNCENLQPDEDSFKSRFMDSSGTDKGFIHIDDEKGLAVSLVSNARFVDIKRYRSTAIRLQSSAIKRLQNDKLFGLAWSAVLFSFMAYRKLARAYIMSRGRQSRLPGSDTLTDNSDEPDTPIDPTESTRQTSANSSTAQSGDSRDSPDNTNSEPEQNP